MKILVVNGPNLNLLGMREPSVYGASTLEDLQKRLKKRYPKVKFEFFQSNSEGEMVDALHKTIKSSVDAIVINPGAYSHYSYAIRDAIAALKIPVVEVHISNVHAREEFRRHSVITPVCKGVVAGFGGFSYELAVQFLVDSKRTR